MEKNFTKKDPKIGYIVKLENGGLYMVMESEKDGTVLVNAGGFFTRLKGYKDDLTREATYMFGYKIDEVYGYRERGADACDISTVDRKLLWKREEPKKKMTVAEIEKELGYSVEIIVDKA